MLGLSGKHKKLVISAAFVLGLSFSWLGSTAPTYAAPGDTANQTDASKDATKNTGSGDETTCAIEKMGWILCPIIETSGKVADSAFQQLAKHFLETEPELVASVSTDPNGTKPGTFVAWGFARNIANIMFIIAFLIIIFSQVTGQGINNYGIKKLLPKLVIAAIAVNISYYICQAMVDLTNIMGYEIQNFLVETARGVSDKSAMPIAATKNSITQTSAVLGNGTLAVIAIGALSLAGTVFILLPLLGSSIFAVLVVCLGIVIILLMRKAFIVLLVVVSPIAFVMYLLPNTERLFQKWLKMFWQLLMVFPVVGLLFGGGQLASAIVLVAGTQQGQGTDAQNIKNQYCDKKTLVKNVYSDCSDRCVQLPSSDPQNNEDTVATIGTCGSRSTPLMLGLVAAGIAVAPLFAVWSVLKGALSAAGAIGGRVSGAVSSTSRKASKYSPEKSIRNRAMQSAATRALNGGFGKRTAGFVRRRQLSGQRADARLKAAQSGFDAQGGSDIAMDTLAAQQAANAAQKGLAQKFVNQQIQNPNYVGNSLGKNAGGVVGQALGAQYVRARDDAQKEIEARLDPGDLKALGDQLEAAVRDKDQITARAIQSTLLRAGGGGQKEFHRAIENVASTDTDGVMASALRANMLQNHPGYKDKDWAAGVWAETQNAALSELAGMRADVSTYAGMTATQFAGQSKQAQVQAAPHLSATTISDLQKKENAQLLANVGPDARRTLGF